MNHRQLWTKIQQLVPAGEPLRFHLGCGEQRLAGYVNIDFPSDQHTVQQKNAADIGADIGCLQLPFECAAEIRSHHLFEHFSRPLALALLAQWNDWLQPGGALVIETPDWLASWRMWGDPQLSFADRQVVLRHLFGSHEGAWAVHQDAWYEDKFRFVLPLFGFTVEQTSVSQWHMTHNITVRSSRSYALTRQQAEAAAREALRVSMVDGSALETRLLEVWLAMFCQRLDETGISAAGRVERCVHG